MTTNELSDSAHSEARRVADTVQRDYSMVAVLDDGSVAALGELMFTRAIYLGVTEYGWARRFCFADRELATQQFLLLKSEDDVPMGHIARRPE